MDKNELRELVKRPLLIRNCGSGLLVQMELFLLFRDTS